MRLALLVVPLLLLAGCAAPDDDKEDDPLFGLCPQWAHGPGTEAGSLDLAGAGNATHTFAAVNATYLDRPLDLYRIVITRADVDGVLELRAEDADGERLTLRDYRGGDAQVVPVVSIASDAVGDEFDVFLSPVLDDGPAGTAPARLLWTLDGARASVGFDVTYHYKVCGV